MHRHNHHICHTDRTKSALGLREPHNCHLNRDPVCSHRLIGPIYWDIHAGRDQFIDICLLHSGHYRFVPYKSVRMVVHIVIVFRCYYCCQSDAQVSEVV